MTNLNTAVTWVDARDRLPRSGTPVAAAITGRYPADSATESDTASGEEFWLVMPMYFTTQHWSEDGTEHVLLGKDAQTALQNVWGPHPT
ncbi:AQJ64_40280 family protein [Streptomyces lincolnensis]|uniref:AQJ64_40280 family protein n=1 Tax=Streptomyces lincolnensis TaxID=1915 RepID=UPI0037D956CF